LSKYVRRRTICNDNETVTYLEAKEEDKVRHNEEQYFSDW
jgi:hypothetical protein